MEGNNEKDHDKENNLEGITLKQEGDLTALAGMGAMIGILGLSAAAIGYSVYKILDQISEYAHLF